MKKQRMHPHLYVLEPDGKTPRPCENIIEWGILIEADNQQRVVAYTAVGNGAGEEAEVSTVFLGIDYRALDRGAPLLWETMVFGGSHDRWCKRYASYDEALAGHHDVVAFVKADLTRR
jgi:hypothetical protein